MTSQHGRKAHCFMTRSEVKAILRKEKEKAFESCAYLDLEPPYSVEVASKLYRRGSVVPEFPEV